MYYRYKSKDSKNPFFSIVLPLVIISAIVWAAYMQRERLMFWKMSDRKIASILTREASVETAQEKLTRLRALEKNAQHNCEKNPYNPAMNYLYASILFGIGEALSDMNFTSYCAVSGGQGYTAESINVFLDSIRHIKKGMAVDETRPVPDDILIKLMYMYYVTRYYPVEELSLLSEEIASAQQLSDTHERRFYGFLRIKSGAVEEGIEFLRQYGSIESFGEKFFLASMYAEAGQYTDAITVFTELQREAPDVAARRKITRALGDLFFRQMLYSEALAQYLALFQELPDDQRLKQAIGDTYTAMGDAQNASLYMTETAGN